MQCVIRWWLSEVVLVFVLLLLLGICLCIFNISFILIVYLRKSLINLFLGWLFLFLTGVGMIFLMNDQFWYGFFELWDVGVTIEEDNGLTWLSLEFWVILLLSYLHDLIYLLLMLLLISFIVISPGKLIDRGTLPLLLFLEHSIGLISLRYAWLIAYGCDFKSLEIVFLLLLLRIVSRVVYRL